MYNFEKKRKKNFTRPLILHKLLCNGSALIRYRKPTDRVKLNHFPTYLIVDKLPLKRHKSENFEFVVPDMKYLFCSIKFLSNCVLIRNYIGKVHTF